MSSKTSTPAPPRMALIVHSDMGALSSLQSALSAKGFTSIVARDLPTALLAITHHYFEVAIVSSQLAEGGDGWPLAGVLHLVFPKAFVAVVSPVEPDVLTLQAAINYGVREVYRQSTPAPEVVDAIVKQLGSGARSSGKARVQ
jgi:ActR/RegA family two-component response regulator